MDKNIYWKKEESSRIHGKNKEDIRESKSSAEKSIGRNKEIDR